MKQKLKSIGVIVARLQVAELHAGHLYLINHVLERHEQVLIVLGTRRGVRSKQYQLTYEERAIMVRQTFPQESIHILPLEDHPYSRERWSMNLDALISEVYPGQQAVLYGSRESFIPLYSGKLPVEIVPQLNGDSGTSHREKLEFPHTREARAAIIYEIEHRHPFMYATSDLAIVSPATDQVLLIGKNWHDGLLSFVGGHAEKKDGTAAEVARREGCEEVLNIKFGSPKYIDTVVIQDPRYRDTPDGVMTTFFAAEFLEGEPSSGDDADRVEWVYRKDLSRVLVPWHRPLGELLNANWPPYL